MDNVTVTVADVRPYIVRQGDYVAKVVAQVGGDEAEVWQHAKNRPLIDAGRTREVLAPGDVLYVPDAPCEPQGLRLGADNPLAAKVKPVRVELVFRHGERPLAAKKYRVLDTGGVIEGQTDGEGRFTFEISPFVRCLRVVFEDPFAVHHIEVGHVDPVTEASGVIGRLQELGYLELGPTADVPETAAREALARFQREHGIESTGETDDETRARLEKEFGS